MFVFLGVFGNQLIVWKGGMWRSTYATDYINVNVFVFGVFNHNVYTFHSLIIVLLYIHDSSSK